METSGMGWKKNVVTRGGSGVFVGTRGSKYANAFRTRNWATSTWITVIEDDRRSLILRTRSVVNVSVDGRFDSAMAAKSATQRRRSEGVAAKLLRNKKFVFAGALLFADAVLVALIIAYVPYTKIDWDAYMSQVSGFLGGERDYGNLKGDTGPLVYPAGFLYVYSAIRYVTGGEVYPAQILFGILYILNLGIILVIYVKTDVLPWWALSLLCLSKRVHSIFVLRLFNDCIAMMLLHASLASILYQKWHLGLIIFSGAVSIKMNVLLYAPPLLLLMLKAMDIIGVISALACAALVQILLGLPFIISHPFSYISRAFNLGRVFIHFWSVNFKFVPEPIFVSKSFAVYLLIAHLLLLIAFAHYRWCKHEGGILNFLHSIIASTKLRFALASSTSSKNSSSSHKALKILKAELWFGNVRYRHNNVCWELHWHYMRSITALSILLMVLLQLTISPVEDELSYVVTDGHNGEDSKQSTADMSAFVSIFISYCSEVCSGQDLPHSVPIIRWFYYISLTCNALDDMGTRINELEQSINELKTEMGMEGTPSPMAPSKPNVDDVKQEEGSA
ncbi:Dol-P-Man:Man(5)GlcNAc(2)-PP-Dol alpha-1,3-mannosyltransferase [Morus notabilis]|uniref:dolichyl-P-Man:Man5GlcNAc2-PP-dolichol alpha-1,3-mannosyltransferase n=1 Tax=Morus notabilis TaxID=981085 RepID=W9QUA1_9ROSA|nr:Dol-P-Man:Man(5)GlcNAc(2)-PP-Dol alpha-1,3-mannosyltransferase [Morus notabilis]